MTLTECNNIVFENTQLSAASENAASSMIDVLLHVICYRLSTSSESHSSARTCVELSVHFSIGIHCGHAVHVQRW